MASYPTLPTTMATRDTIEDGRSVLRATNGALKVRRLYAADTKRFDLEHRLSASDKSTLDTFYGTNADLDVTYVYPADGASYTVRFVAAPAHQVQPGKAAWITRVQLAEV